MGPEVVVVLVLTVPMAVLLTVGGAVAHLQRSFDREDKRADETWEVLARNYALSFSRGYTRETRTVEREVAGQVSGLPVYLETVTHEAGSSAGRRTTRGWVSVEHCGLPEIEVHTNQPHALIGKSRGLTAFKTGDADFDAVLEVRAADPTIALAVLNAKARRALLDLHTAVPTARFARDHVQWSEPGSVVELRRLQGVLDALINAALALRTAAGSTPVLEAPDPF